MRAAVLVAITLCACSTREPASEARDGGADAVNDASSDAAPPTPAPLAGCAVRCHGQDTNAAPPQDLRGNMATSVATVGAHQLHLVAGASWHRRIACSACHVVPGTVDAPGHIDGDQVAEVIFDKMNPQGKYAKTTATCSALYCHGDGLGNNGTISFIPSDALACDSCHGLGSLSMSGAHTAHWLLGVSCSDCHADEVDSNRLFLKPALHINGVHDAKLATGTWDPATRSCANTGCHGTFTW